MNDNNNRLDLFQNSHERIHEHHTQDIPKVCLDLANTGCTRIYNFGPSTNICL